MLRAAEPARAPRGSDDARHCTASRLLEGRERPPERSPVVQAARTVRVSIGIDVPDLSAATSFYCDALGCSVDKQQPSHNTLSVPRVTMQLLLKEAGTAATGNGTAKRNYERQWTPVHLDFDVDDLDAAVAVVKRSGGSVESVNRGEREPSRSVPTRSAMGSAWCH